jgi:dihydrofolate reductase
VASRTLDAVEWNNSTLLEGDVAEAVAALKAEDGPEIQVHGSGDLLQTLFAHGLVDRLQLMIFPVVLGGGKRLFGGSAAPAGLKLVDSSVFSSGVVLAAYEREGDVKYGTFALEEPNEAEQARRAKLRES